MSEVKIYKIKGSIKKSDLKIPFLKEIRALNQKNALEKIYAELGGRQSVKRVHINIDNIEEIKID